MDGDVLRKNLEIIETDPEGFLALEFYSIHRDEISKMFPDAGRSEILLVIYRAMKFYRDWLKEVMWEKKMGMVLKERLRNSLVLAAEKAKRLREQNEGERLQMFG